MLTIRRKTRKGTGDRKSDTHLRITGVPPYNSIDLRAVRTRLRPRSHPTGSLFTALQCLRFVYFRFCCFFFFFFSLEKQAHEINSPSERITETEWVILQCAPLRRIERGQLLSVKSVVRKFLPTALQDYEWTQETLDAIAIDFV